MTASCAGLFVIARTSTFAYKGKPVSIQQVGRDLGVRPILEGSILKAGQRVRINAQLADAANGANLWTQSFDRPLKDIFALQDDDGRCFSSLVKQLMRDKKDGVGIPHGSPCTQLSKAIGAGPFGI
jgi:adenylate cyclase